MAAMARKNVWIFSLDWATSSDRGTASNVGACMMMELPRAWLCIIINVPIIVISFC